MYFININSYLCIVRYVHVAHALYIALWFIDTCMPHKHAFYYGYR
jgi:hypothetical protein